MRTDAPPKEVGRKTRAPPILPASWVLFRTPHRTFTGCPDAGGAAAQLHDADVASSPFKAARPRVSLCIQIGSGSKLQQQDGRNLRSCWRDLQAATNVAAPPHFWRFHRSGAS